MALHSPMLSLLDADARFAVQITGTECGPSAVRLQSPNVLERVLPEETDIPDLLQCWPRIERQLGERLVNVEQAISTLLLPIESVAVPPPQRCSLLIMKSILLAREIEQRGDQEREWVGELLTVCREEMRQGDAPCHQRLVRELFFTLLEAELEDGERRQGLLQTLHRLDDQLAKHRERDPSLPLCPLPVYLRVLKRRGPRPTLRVTGKLV